MQLENEIKEVRSHWEYRQNYCFLKKKVYFLDIFFVCLTKKGISSLFWKQAILKDELMTPEDVL